MGRSTGVSGYYFTYSSVTPSSRSGDFSYPEDVIRRCTRDGVVSWQHVGQQCGLSAEEARRRWDPQHLPIRPWHQPCEAVTPKGEPIEPEAIDENDTSSPHPKGPGLKLQILLLIKQHRSLSVADLAERLIRPRASIRARLSDLREGGLVENDGFFRPNGVLEWTWILTEAGRRVAVAGCADKEREVA